MKSIKERARTPQEFRRYMSSDKAYWFWTTMIVVVATTITVLTVPENSYPLAYMRYVLGFVFVLWLPGYTFIMALFPTKMPIKTSSESLDAVERIALSFSMSLALVPIVDLLLNYTRWGIRPTSITLSLLALTVAFALVAVLRDYQTKAEGIKTQE